MLELLPRETPVDEVEGNGEFAAAGREGGLIFDRVEEELFEAGRAVGVCTRGGNESGGGEGFHAASAGVGGGLWGRRRLGGSFGRAASGGFLVLLRGASGLAHTVTRGTTREDG